MALPSVDADRPGGRHGAVRLRRPVVVSAIQRLEIGDGRNPGRHQHPLLRRDGAPHQLVGLSRLPDAVLHALLSILGEFGIAILLAILAKRLRQGNWTTALLAGVAGGVGIFVCYAIA